MTTEEVCILMRQLEFVFDTVRLVDASLNTQFYISSSGEIKEEAYSCYAVWKKEKRCENCISAKVFSCRHKMTKFEFVNDDIYHVTALYIEVEGRHYVMELVSKIDDEILFEAYGKNEFAETITRYNQKLYIDPVTGAYNRQYYNEQLRALTNINAVAMLDMDNFKAINDIYGHSAGDLALKTVSNILNSFIGASDSVVRYGGDEFLIIFPKISLEDFSKRLDRIRKAINSTGVKNYPEIELSISIGGAYGMAQTAKMFEKADAMLYCAKCSKNNVQITEYYYGKQEDNTSKAEKSTVSTGSEVLQFKGNEQMRMLAYESLQRAFDTMPIAFAIIRVMADENGDHVDFRFEYLNNAMAELEGMTKEELLGGRFYELFHDPDPTRLRNYYLSAYCGEYHRMHRFSGEINKYLDIRSYPWEEGYCACILLDETDLVNSRASMVYAANHDALTGFGNRDSYALYHRELEKSPPASIGIAIIDINNLSRINQGHGNDFGDRVLKKTAECIKSYFSSEHAFRIGGDEFIIAERDCPREVFMEKLGKVREKIKALDFGDVSCGYIWERNPKNIDTLYNNADKLMHIEKEESYLKSDTRHISRNTMLLNKLLKDLDDNRYLIYIQPQVDIEHSARICGAEALVRFRDDNGQIVTPVHFIKSMEEEMIIPHLDFAVFEEVCRTLSVWKEQTLPPDFRIAVNFSRVTLALPDFLDVIEKIRKESGIEPSLLTIEITETQETYSKSRMESLFSALHSAGYAISLDDFGTGSSSIENVAAISWSSLKFDMSLVQMLPDSAQMADLLSYICEYANKYNIACIAEGVETEEQLDAVRKIGCNAAQGFYYAMPMPKDDFYNKYLAAEQFRTDCLR